MLHALKTNTEYYKFIESGQKTFEVRKKDRPFAQGDDIVLQEWLPNEEKYTGKEWFGKISYLMDDPDYCKKGYCIMGIKPKESDY